MNPKETCDTCVYFEESPIIPNGGVCHRNPPTIMIGMTAEGPRPVGSAFPPTLSTGWCGEWKKGSAIRLASKMPVEPVGISIN